MKLSLANISIFVIVLGGCTNGQGEVDITENNVASFPGAPAGAARRAPVGSAVTTEADVVLDLQKQLASLSHLGTLSATISKNTISGPDLALVDHIKATIASEDGTMPEQVACDVDVPRAATEFALPLLVSDSLLLEYLTAGKVDFHFSLTGPIPDRSLTLTHAFVAHMSVTVKGSVLKL